MNSEQIDIINKINEVNLIAIKKISNSGLRKTLFSIIGIVILSAFTVYFTAIKNITTNTVKIDAHSESLKEKVSGGVFVTYCSLLSEKWDYLKEGQDKNSLEIKEIDKKIDELIKEYKLVKRSLIINKSDLTLK